MMTMYLTNLQQLAISNDPDMHYGLSNLLHCSMPLQIDLNVHSQQSEISSLTNLKQPDSLTCNHVFRVKSLRSGRQQRGRQRTLQDDAKEDDQANALPVAIRSRRHPRHVASCDPAYQIQLHSITKPLRSQGQRERERERRVCVSVKPSRSPTDLYMYLGLPSSDAANDGNLGSRDIFPALPLKPMQGN